MWRKLFFLLVFTGLSGWVWVTSARALEIPITAEVEGETEVGGESQLMIEPETVLADGESEAAALVFLRNSQNEPISGQEVTLKTSRPDKDVIEKVRPTTEVDGVAVFTIKSQFAGETIVSAYLGEQQAGETESLQFFQRSGVFLLRDSPLLALAGLFVALEFFRWLWLLLFARRRHEPESKLPRAAT